jgi:transcriptional regulator with XRE-family HTH domain
VIDAGVQLREARQARGLSLDQVSAATKIPAHTLEDIEENRFDRLPGGIFARAHLRAFADEVGVDAGAVLEAYANRRFGGTEEVLPIARPPGVETESRFGRLLLIEVAAAALLIAGYSACRASDAFATADTPAGQHDIVSTAGR